MARASRVMARCCSALGRAPYCLIACTGGPNACWRRSSRRAKDRLRPNYRSDPALAAARPHHRLAVMQSLYKDTGRTAAGKRFKSLDSLFAALRIAGLQKAYLVRRSSVHHTDRLQNRAAKQHRQRQDQKPAAHTHSLRLYQDAASLHSRVRFLGLVHAGDDGDPALL